MSTRRPSGHDEYDSVGDRDREEPSTLILETSSIAEQYKPEGMVGGGERSMVEVDEDAETGILCGTTDKRGIPMDVCDRTGQAGREGVPRDDAVTSEVAEEAEAESTNTDVGEATYLSGKVHGAERSTRRARVRVERRARG